MGIIKAFTDSISGTFADQWKEIITVHAFDEPTAVSPGVVQESNNGSQYERIYRCHFKWV